MNEVFSTPLDASPNDTAAELDVRFLVTELLGANPRRSIVVPPADDIRRSRDLEHADQHDAIVPW